MSDFVLPLLLFACKILIILFFILLLLAACLALVTKNNLKDKEQLIIKNINKQYEGMRDILYETLLPKKTYKKRLKISKQLEQQPSEKKRIFVLQFHGDIKASGVARLRQEITAILTIATPQDEVILKLYSTGGMIPGYGLAAAQLMRLRQRCIPLTIAIDQVAASGGYMMACIANQIIAAPFAMIGSIGVIVQLPNFHRFLQDKKIDFEQLTAGQYKRTLTVFGENKAEQREKLTEELNDIHEQFKQLILTYRPQIAIDQVATGEYWLGQQALPLKLIDAIKTSDEYLLEKSQNALLYALQYQIKKSFTTKLISSISKMYQHIFSLLSYPATPTC